MRHESGPNRKIQRPVDFFQMLKIKDGTIYAEIVHRPTINTAIKLNALTGDTRKIVFYTFIR